MNHADPSSDITRRLVERLERVGDSPSEGIMQKQHQTLGRQETRRPNPARLCIYSRTWSHANALIQGVVHLQDSPDNVSVYL